jgi:hypothetical protein
MATGGRTWVRGSLGGGRGPGQGTPPEVDLVEGEGSRDDWGAWEERRGYSAEEIRRARILPDLPWGRSVRGLPGTWRKGPRRLGARAGTHGRSGALY